MAKIHMVIIWWTHEDGTDSKVHHYFSSKKKAITYLKTRREGWENYNPSNKWAYYHSDDIN